MLARPAGELHPPARAATASRNARRTARRTPHGVQKRGASRTPTPAQSTRAALSAMSPAAGQTSTGTPHASARASVPCPPWVTTRSHSGIVSAYDIHGTSTALAGAGRGSEIAITRTGSSASPSRHASSRRCDGSCEVEVATSTTGPRPGGGETRGPPGSHSIGPTTRCHGCHARGYSSCGNVPTIVSARDNPVCT